MSGEFGTRKQASESKGVIRAEWSGEQPPSSGIRKDGTTKEEREKEGGMGHTYVWHWQGLPELS